MFKHKKDSDLTKRIKSLLWRSAMMAIAVFVNALATNVGMLELSPEMTVFIGLILGEISKQLNKKTNVR